MKKIIGLILSLVLVAGITVLPVSAATEKDDQSSLRTFSSLAELNSEGVNLGIVTGMATDVLCEEFLPNATLKFYNNVPDLLYALSIGQVDAFLEDEPMCRYLVARSEGTAVLEEPVGPYMDTAFVMGETDFDRKVQDELNTFIKKLKSEGAVEKILEVWYGTDEKKQVISIPSEGENGIIKAAVCTQSAPACMIKDGEIVGAEIDILSRFCTEYGYGLELTDMDFNGLINGVESGRFDIAASYISITEERKGNVNFSEPYMSSTCLMIMRAPEEGNGGFLAGLSESFKKTFVKEDRWKLIVQGLETTIRISLGAAIIGTLLGFGLCLLRRMKNRVIHGATTVYVRVLQGTPILVILMILYYIVFAKSGTGGQTVAIIAFALNFAAYTCEMFRTGIDGVDRGQTEAALAIGYTKVQTFFKIVMPQAAERFLPVYKGEFISLVKMTSIVGYVAVQDLTKMSDIIRARTYEAFFPLISTAVIYFVLCTIITGLLKLIEIKIAPDRKNRKIKGVVMK